MVPCTLLPAVVLPYSIIGCLESFSNLMSNLEVQHNKQVIHISSLFNSHHRSSITYAMIPSRSALLDTSLHAPYSLDGYSATTASESVPTVKMWDMNQSAQLHNTHRLHVDILHRSEAAFKESTCITVKVTIICIYRLYYNIWVSSCIMSLSWEMWMKYSSWSWVQLFKSA